MLSFSVIFNWWQRQLKSALPWLPVQGNGPPDALIIDVEQFGLAPAILTGSLSTRRGGYEEVFAALGPSPCLPPKAASLPRVVLRLPPDMMLQRKLILPARAKHHLKTVIGFEMDRLTPFSMPEVFWNIAGLACEKRHLSFTLLIVPRRIVQPLLAALAKMKLEPSRIETGFGEFQISACGSRPANPARNALIGICCAFALAMALLPFIQQQRQMDEVSHQLQALMPEQSALAALYRQLTNFDAGPAIVAATGTNGDALQILAMLTDALPNGSWLDSLALTQDEIIVAGKSNNAARLITVLAAAPAFHDPSFVGPVTRSMDDGSEIFSIQAGISK